MMKKMNINYFRQSETSNNRLGHWINRSNRERKRFRDTIKLKFKKMSNTEIKVEYITILMKGYKI